MNRRFYICIFLLVALVCSPGCLFRRNKSQAKPKTYDVLGTVQTVSPLSITVQTNKGAQTFAMNNATVRGGEFKPGMLVHVYYQQNSAEKVATMVVEKVK